MGGRFGGADNADADDGCRLGNRRRSFPGGALASRGQGARRPQVSASATLFYGSQHHLASLAGGVWQLEQRVEAVLAAEPKGRLRGDARHFGRNERYRSPCPDGRFDDRARPRLGGRRKRGQQGQALGRSRGGFSSKIHLKTDFDGLPLAFHLTGGEASDSRNFALLLDIGPDITPSAVLAHKGYDAKANPEAPRRRGICPAIPYRQHAAANPASLPTILH